LLPAQTVSRFVGNGETVWPSYWSRFMAENRIPLFREAL
jgi:hypothetical protein